MEKNNQHKEKDNEYATCIAMHGEDSLSLAKEVMDRRRLADAIDLALKKEDTLKK